MHRLRSIKSPVEIELIKTACGITKKGLALQLTLQGTKYYKDDDLNKP